MRENYNPASSVNGEDLQGGCYNRQCDYNVD